MAAAYYQGGNPSLQPDEDDQDNISALDIGTKALTEYDDDMAMYTFGQTYGGSAEPRVKSYGSKKINPAHRSSA